MTRSNGGGGTLPSEPEVSVVVPTRDRLPLLAQTVHTVLGQRDVELEVVVVDEASSDGTSDWLLAHPDPRVRTVRHEAPRGLSEARNAGVATARGHWLAFTDDDDLWLPSKLADQLDAARRRSAHWTFGATLTFTPEPRLLQVNPIPAEPVERLPWINTIPGGGSNAIVARVAIELVGGFDPSIDIVADWDMWLKLAELGPPAVVSHPVMAYRIHQNNMSGNLARMLAGIDAIERRYEHRRDGSPIDWPQMLDWLHLHAWRTGDRRMARQVALASLDARDLGSVGRLVRSALPVHRRLPTATPGMRETFRDRIRPRSVVPWPPDTEIWVREALRVGA